MDDMSIDKERRGTALSCLTSLSLSSADLLRARWITSVEQFVATAATAQGRNGLEALLCVSTATMDALLLESSALLGSERYALILKPKPGGSLGALFADPRGRPAQGDSKGGAP